ncbi:MAG: UDP-N-acetylmuramate dehydrogenase [Desulfotomaculaceae bacterium]|nr:UDP-N-acetylmuramate dehydrogenase [Desulfotomaculaceae bacterium]MDD4766432.1 UDP-N-acetylmuramate dehydrogenase [Desulfotomaculaceae bacterium]
MADSTICLEMLKILPGRVRISEPMKKHTSWRIGGPADVFVTPANREELRLAVSYAYEREIPLTIIGAGTNILVADEGIRGVVVKVGCGLDRISVDDNMVIAESGAKLSKVAAVVRDAGLGGFEFSAGIPGNIGGALVMNAGANGTAIGTRVKEVLLLNQAGCFFKKTIDEINFGYRSSALQHDSAVVVEAVFSCYHRDKEAIKHEMEVFIKRRKETQPLHYPSAGSIFKNPPGDSAGRLIEAVGLKGERIGDAQISTLHANFIINLGEARARDIMMLVERARNSVLGHFGIELKPEVKVVGYQ